MKEQPGLRVEGNKHSKPREFHSTLLFVAVGHSISPTLSLPNHSSIDYAGICSFPSSIEETSPSLYFFFLANLPKDEEPLAPRAGRGQLPRLRVSLAIAHTLHQRLPKPECHARHRSAVRGLHHGQGFHLCPDLGRPQRMLGLGSQGRW